MFSPLPKTYTLRYSGHAHHLAICQVAKRDLELICTCTSGRVWKTTPCSQKSRGHLHRQPLVTGLEYGQKPKPAILCLQNPPILNILMSMRNQGLCFSSYLKGGDSDSTRQLDTLQCQSQGEKPPLWYLQQCATCSPCQR